MSSRLLVLGYRQVFKFVESREEMTGIGRSDTEFSGGNRGLIIRKSRLSDLLDVLREYLVDLLDSIQLNVMAVKLSGLAEIESIFQRLSG